MKNVIVCVDGLWIDVQKCLCLLLQINARSTTIQQQREKKFTQFRCSTFDRFFRCFAVIVLKTMMTKMIGLYPYRKNKPLWKVHHHQIEYYSNVM